MQTRGVGKPRAADASAKGAKQMRSLSLSRYALSVCVVATLLAACGGSQGTSSTIPGSGMKQYSSRPSSDWPLPSIGAVPAKHHHKYAGLKDLYVTDPFYNDVEILANGTYKNVGS